MGLFNKKKAEKVDIDESKWFGGFILSKNVLNGILVRYSYKEENSIPELNEWTIYSFKDDDEYVSNPDNFEIVGIGTIIKICPMMIKIFDAPYGTDLCWQYTPNLKEFTGFYDLKNNKDVTIEEILGHNK